MSLSRKSRNRNTQSHVTTQEEVPMSSSGKSSSRSTQSHVTTEATSASTMPGGVANVRPPANAVAPSPPATWKREAAIDLRGQVPHKSERALVPGAIDDLRRFTGFGELFGRFAPSLAVMIDTLEAASAWSTVGESAQDWAYYVEAQEGLAWTSAQALLLKVKPVFDLAVAADAGLALQYPTLTRLLDTRRALARRSAAVRMANNRDVAAGREPSRGKAATRRKRVLKEAASITAPASTPGTTPFTGSSTESASRPPTIGVAHGG